MIKRFNMASANWEWLWYTTSMLLLVTTFTATAGEVLNPDAILKGLTKRVLTTRDIVCTGCLPNGGIKAEDSLPKGSSIDLDITFAANSAKLLPEARTQLDYLATAMQQLPNNRFEIAGHTDANGTEEHNKSLSQRRAKAVVAYLHKHGIKATHLTAKGYGSKYHKYQPPTDPQNRRVQVINLGPLAAGL